MKKILFAFLPLLVLLASCVSQSAHDKLKSEKEAIEQDRNMLKAELGDIKFGAPNLLLEGKKFFSARDFQQARIKLTTLVEKHPDMSESIEAKSLLAIIDEEDAWDKALTLDDISFVKNYIEMYPGGKYITKARRREKELRILHMEKAYNAAESQNSSYVWEKFLKDYPNYVGAEAIRRKIIRLRVEEIAGDSQTGRMPGFSQVEYGYSANSSVSIRNNTGCDLTVWYSGPDAESVVIPAGATRSVYLSSGNYRVAASACGSNYAGSENLQGSYSSTFYISTSRY